MRSRAELDQNQVLLTNEIKKRKRVLLACPMGFGKSVITATAVLDLLNSWEVTQVLIVAPLRVALHTWPDEFEAWEHLKGLEYSVLVGTEEARVRAAKRSVPIHIINRENLVWLYEFWGDRWPYDCLVYDEASRLKGGKKRTTPSKKPRKDGKLPTRNISEFGALAKVRQLMPYKIELTGTPAPNGLVDMWGVIYPLDGGDRLSTSKTAFLKRWFTPDFNGYKYEPRDGAFKEIMGLVRDVMLSMPERMKDAPVYNRVDVSLSPRCMKEYTAFKKTLVDEPRNIEAKNAGVLGQKLLQFANGSVYNEHGVDKHVHNEKLDALESVIEEAAGSPVLVFYSFQFDRAAILKRFRNAEVIGKDPTVIKRWNAGQIPILLAHPASAGHGLNLQFGGHIAAWYGLTWNLELYQQANKRLHRPGQKHTVYLHHILARGTIDDRLYEILPQKADVQDRVLRAVLLKEEDRAAAEGVELNEMMRESIVNEAKQNRIIRAIIDDFSAI